MNTRAVQPTSDIPGPDAPWLYLSRSGAPVREALVLAAGRGSRLGGPTPKPLHRLLGLPLLARTLLTLERTGITDAYIVLGYRADDVRREIEAIGRFEMRLHWLYNDQWERPNGLSVLAARDRLRRPFVLAMGDHVFASASVERLLEHVHGLEGVDLLVDRDTDRVADIDEATKVRLDADRIVDIGKTLDTFDAIDTGLFLATPALFEALRECVIEGRETLSDGVERLAEEGAARAIDAEGVIWEDVDTPADAERAERKLLDGLRKDQDGPVARLINRRISSAITRRLVNTPITPNQVSIATLGVGLLAAGLAAVGGYGPWLAAGLLFQLASILDGVDGELATLTFQTSRKGEWVDTICDNISYLAFLIGLTIGVARAGFAAPFVWGGIVSVVAAFLGIASINLYMLRERRSGSARSVRYGYQEESDEPPSLITRVLRVLHYFGKRDLFSFLLALMALAGVLPLALPIFGTVASVAFVPAAVKASLRAWRRSQQVRIARSEAVDAS